MSVRTHLSRQTRSGRHNLNWNGSYVALSSVEETNLTAPIKIYVEVTYAGVVSVSLSNNAADKIREVNPGQTHYFDECYSPHQLYINSSVSDAGEYLYYRYGIN